jgi:vacuolar protein sorting-associated protein 72
MAEENDEDTPMRTEEESSDSATGSRSDSEEEQVEWMVTAREKRSTAGNRLTSLIQQEEPDDELELLFAEDDDDAGFEDAEADHSDVQMDSSDDDDDDQGPAAGADDLEGEKELQKLARAEKQKRRKLNDGIPKIFKRRVKIDPTASQSPAPRPKKKSERASWIPTAADMPTRASQRGTTKLSKQQLHVQMVDREIKRLRQLENMEKAAAAKEASKKPAMTQADRLAEAARVEKQNSKSLSRWEEAEQQREEEQKAKLAALSNRQLNGPVITWWSGMAEWVGGKLRQVGKILVAEEQKEVKPRKRKAAEMEADAETGPSAAPVSNGESSKPDEKLPDAPAPPTSPARPTTSILAPPPVDRSAPPDIQNPPQPALPQTNDSAPPSGQTPPEPAPSLVNGSLPPIDEPATTGPPHSSIQPSSVPQSSPQPMVVPPTPTPPPYPAFTLAPPIQPPIPALDGSAPLPGFGPSRLMPSPTIPFAFTPSYPPLPPPPPANPSTPPPPTVDHAARNYLILTNFDENAIKSKDVQTQILFNRKFTKVPSMSPILPLYTQPRANTNQNPKTPPNSAPSLPTPLSTAIRQQAFLTATDMHIERSRD